MLERSAGWREACVECGSAFLNRQVGSPFILSGKLCKIKEKY